MPVPELAESRGATVGQPSAPARAFRPAPAWLPALLLAATIVVGAILRVIIARQSVFADELSTYWISATHSLGGVLSLMYGTGAIKHAEITPPLTFLLSWLTTQAGHSPQLLRLPELVAGTATIPLVYLIGRRTIGRRTALVAAALTALSPFMIYYSSEARAYGVMMFCVVVSTLAALKALGTGRARWWVLYAVAACAAFYSHYTSGFVLAVQFLWVLWAHPEARRRVLIASVAAALGVLPWLPGLIRDFQSPTLKILAALSPFTVHDVRVDIEHWAVGYPYTLAGGLRGLPGTVALIAIGAALAITLAGLVAIARRSSLRRILDAHDRRLTLLVVLALATPVGEALESLRGDHVFGVRNLAASWPYLALAGAAALTASRGRLAAVASALAILGFGLGAARMLEGGFQRPDYQGAAAFVAANARPGDVVVDETGSLSPGPLTGLDVALHRRLPTFRAEAPAERGHPYGLGDPVVPLQTAVNQAVKAARGHRVFVVTNVYRSVPLERRINPAPSQFPAQYHLLGERRFPGIGGTLAALYTDTASPSQ